jgi:uncharacterized membrane protein
MIIMTKLRTKKDVFRVDGRLKQITTVTDEKGDIIHKFLSPVMVEVYPRDIMQIIIGAMILAVPVAYTEETWKLGETLPMLNILLLFLMSILFIGVFIYYNYYRGTLKEHSGEFIKRVFVTYLFSMLVVGLLLSLIGKGIDNGFILFLKRGIIVSLPASLSGAVVDTIK